MGNKWPDFATAENIAKMASASGLLLRMEMVDDETWGWKWLHLPSGMDFDGQCDTTQLPVAFICALMSMPIISRFPVDIPSGT